MPFTTIDPVTALVVIDLQKGVVGMDTAHPAADIVERSRRLAEAFRERGLPVALVTVDAVPSGRTDRGQRASSDFPSDFAVLAPELGPAESDILVTKKTAGAFTSTDLHQQLQSRSVTQLLVTGIATGSGVESTVRHAHELGHNVGVVSDAVTDRDLATHDHSLGTVFPRMAETGTTAEFLDLLESSARS